MSDLNVVKACVHYPHQELHGYERGFQALLENAGKILADLEKMKKADLRATAKDSLQVLDGGRPMVRQSAVQATAPKRNKALKALPPHHVSLT